MKRIQAFIIDSHWDEFSARNEVVLLARGEDETFELRFNNEKFTLFVAADENIDNSKINDSKKLKLKAFNQKPVKALYTKNQSKL